MADPIPLSTIVKAAGGPATLSVKLNISSQAVSQWERVPAERVLAVSDASGFAPHQIRPDLYRAPPSTEAAA
jgi:DNA-binding transcriptional regulator YdaS (Cro superfamily)